MGGASILFSGCCWFDEWGSAKVPRVLRTAHANKTRVKTVQYASPEQRMNESSLPRESSLLCGSVRVITCVAQTRQRPGVAVRNRAASSTIPEQHDVLYPVRTSMATQSPRGANQLSQGNLNSTEKIQRDEIGRVWLSRR